MRDNRSSAKDIDELQTPGAGPSRQSSRPPDILVPPPQAHLANEATTVRARTPSRTDTLHEDVELGIYLRPESEGRTTVPSSPSSSGIFARRGSAGSVVVSKVSVPAESFFLANSAWRTDILTFCSHARADPVLGDARITQIQARKSHRPPFLHEYLLVFFTAARDQRFVMRIDRLGKVGSALSGGATETQGMAANTAIQEVGIYHVRDSQDGSEEPWLAMDGRWGSRPVATIATWESLSASGEQVSHHARTAALSSAPCPRLKDVSRLLESVLLEMPTYHLTTANCYLMTRSSLLLLQRCYPSSFACYLGAVSNDPIPASILSEPVWAGILRWYLPFVIICFLAYIPLLLFFYRIWSYTGNDCNIPEAYDPDSTCYSFRARSYRAAGYAIHAFLDVPLPVGIMHAYMTSLEVEMNKVVVNLSAQFFEVSRPGTGERKEPAPPFGVLFDDPWVMLAAWCALGFVGGVFVFISMAFQYGLLITFIIVLVLGIGFNFKFGDSGAGIFADQDAADELFGATAQDTVPQDQNGLVKRDRTHI